MSSKLARIRQLSQRTMKTITEALQEFEKSAERLMLVADTEDAASYENESKGKAANTKQLTRRNHKRSEKIRKAA